MKKDILVVVSVVLIAVIAAVIVYGIDESTKGVITHEPGGTFQEEVAITNVFTNGTSNAVFVDVKVIKCDINRNDINFTQAYIEENNGTVAATSNLSILILQGKSATLRVNCTLPTGNYFVTLDTTEDGCFASPTFTIP